MYYSSTQFSAVAMRCLENKKRKEEKGKTLNNTQTKRDTGTAPASLHK
jgi:hypothetical protein